jgi:hypothetical protein
MAAMVAAVSSDSTGYGDDEIPGLARFSVDCADALIAKLAEGQPSGDSGEFIRIPTADWLRLVKLLGSLRLGGSWYPEIDKIVASVNGGE